MTKVRCVWQQLTVLDSKLQIFFQYPTLLHTLKLLIIFFLKPLNRKSENFQASNRVSVSLDKTNKQEHMKNK
ncbi:hypothetical protein ABENE_02435 [Asticcacaulis benevestitus DSM 16100 = ATCC BAA-896]|uniref:Uncharacterized protein n=1 Tax=Asticcacaulis benevestitus DSM 16100 = ATCC BAA-896 TaxID=1121022 RepID=V4RT84_9CAUL|nr:hypothetical protein ABENE_02435 [Asticcacaulis benevestitus DSM 16100 = ATCC BAA-896]